MQLQTRGIDTEFHNTVCRKRIDPWGQHLENRRRLPMPGFCFGMGVIDQCRPAVPINPIPKFNGPEGKGFRWVEEDEMNTLRETSVVAAVSREKLA